ncbi:uncharacterized protein LOC126375038 [Pectinophora gossypiella]|uniref:uncharacterized protein LOC126375038 n=1 Tax=Pectinophora gossypiella TaxID=13191 RepID=UPI00214EF23B|nr:uncharacterized protein LOC126375038 [Pectinophora gossypiella]
MRYKLSVWIGAAVIAIGCAQLVAIDQDIQLPGFPDTTATPVIVTRKESDELHIIDGNNIDESENKQESIEETSGGGGGSKDTEDSGNELNLGPEADGLGDNGNGGEREGGTTEETQITPQPDATDVTPELDATDVTQEPDTSEATPELDATPETGATEVTPDSDATGITPEVDATEATSQTDEPQISRSKESDESNAINLVVETESGPVQGFYKDGESGIRSYIDIPYGSFSGLFEPPVKPEPWETIHKANQHEKRCPQIDEDDKFVGETDCLTLSVFAPSDVENAPVLFHIYDGQFRTGSADPTIYGPDYLVPKGIILVLPNYRVGPLGFLCMNNDVAPGNAALKDLTLALSWTKENIEHFGGNSSNIVVSGYGMSGALAGYLALSQKSRNYVSGVITESGSVLAPWAIDRNPQEKVTKLTEALEEDITNEINLESLLTSAKDIHFMPCVETGPDAFMNETPWTFLQTENTKINIPFLIGSANHAGLHEAMQHTGDTLCQLNSNFSRFLPNDLKFKDENEKSEVAEKVKKQYFYDNNINTSSIHNVSLSYTDAYYLGPAVRVSRDLVKAGANVYLYEFSFVGDLNRESGALLSTVHGAARGDIIGYTFVQDDDVPLESTDEEQVVTMITDLWVAFLKEGKPSIDDVAWHELENTEEANEQWLSIDSEVELQKGLHVSRLALWTQIYEDHYIERNLAREMQSSLLVLTTALLLLGLRKQLSGMLVGVVVVVIGVVCGAEHVAVRVPPLPWRPRRDVTLLQGRVRGYLGPQHYAFLGIPYASPFRPTDRFKIALPPPEWDGILEATYRVKCLQSSGAGDENCLVVNVFVPERMDTPLPVLVHVHDGGFHSGWGAYKPAIRLIKDFVIVTFNYRLGALGFLCLGTPEAPGNAGLKDQMAALHWIQQNIASFGGNPDDVTVYGTGSGAISIQLLLLSGLTNGIIHKVILESGSVLSPTAMSYNPFSTAYDIAISLGYEGNGKAYELVEFYQNLSESKLASISSNFLPCVENNMYYAHSLLDQDPMMIFQHDTYHKVPMLIAYTNSEEMPLINANYEKFTVIPEVFENWLPNNLRFDNDKSRHKVSEMVKDFYFSENEHLLKEKIVEIFKEYINDICMDYPVHKFAVLYAARSPAPLYIMKYEYQVVNRRIVETVYGDIYKSIFTDDLKPNEGKKMSDILVTLWKNFMTIGDPTPLTSELVPVVWEPINTNGLEVAGFPSACLHIGKIFNMAKPNSAERLVFWDQIYYSFYRNHSFDNQ